MTKFTTIAVLISTILVAACGEKQTPFSSAKIADGQVTVDGKAFDGTLSGISSRTLYGTTAASIVIENNLAMVPELKDGLGNSHCTTKVNEGKLSNVYECTMPSGVVFDIASVDGMMHSTIRGYKNADSKDLVFHADTLNGVLNGNLVISYVDTGKSAYMGSWKNGERVVETIFSHSTGKEIFKAMYRNNAYEGVVQKFADDGETVLFEANYIKGQPDGEMTEFDAEHQVLSKSVYAAGNLTHFQQWVKGSDGQPRMAREAKYNLAGEVIYEHVAPIDLAPMKSPEQYRAEDRASAVSVAEAAKAAKFDKGTCFHSWKAQHVATRGDAPITQMLVDRWIQACGAGQMPG